VRVIRGVSKYLTRTWYLFVGEQDLINFSPSILLTLVWPSLFARLQPLLRISGDAFNALFRPNIARNLIPQMGIEIFLIFEYFATSAASNWDSMPPVKMFPVMR
jgi:hypothetical protein